jgi:hypothetical protein
VINPIRPFGPGSLLAHRQVFLWRTPLILRLGIAQSLLAERLRRRTHFLACLCPTYQVRTDDIQAERRPIEIPAPGPADRYWPSDRTDEERCAKVDSPGSRGIEFSVGTILDQWT